ncbi:LytR/AlgR family response regulator transcription factor [Novosphingobium pentaromativorans]|uniref:Two-component system, LytT family, response regulator n=1 Tax=Novosphingobium pentaromativorans US6-1 TaxID=1088721 RepID=G6E9F8_9SPHN|nr:LytTR family DNA-binding domain-containing protein [Novosphingobium pentaromativorans]AIT81033.1 hypothetical protein JI59_15215 [Novosphingobium pentaromativorans US6-1]EHJ62057.1 hypothetical protein NSU_0979 [Novosphingobium pentaromativorans US6-1]
MNDRRHRHTAVVAEDEDVLREELICHLKQLWPTLKIVGAAGDGIKALSLVERFKPDVVFLDIQMPGLTGIDVARQIDGHCHVVFATAYDEYAVAAFEQGAVDYLMKPYDLARLAQAVERVRTRVDTESPASLEFVLDEISRISAPRKFLQWIKASVGNEIELIFVDDICFFQADTKYTTVATATGDAIIRTSLKQLRNELDPDVFIPIHRSTIVNIRAISKVSRGLDGSMQIQLKDRPERLPVSDANRNIFKMM